MNPVLRTLFDTVTTLDHRKIPYAVMGGLAVRTYAIPRPTNDVDLTISLARNELLGWLNDLERSGVSVPPIYRTGWVDEVAGMPVIKLKSYLDASQSVDIDVFLAETAFQESVLKRRVKVEVEGKTLWLVSPEDLILLKLLARRPRDLIDVADILFVQGELDIDYMRHWSAILDITDRLNEAVSE